MATTRTGKFVPSVAGSAVDIAALATALDAEDGISAVSVSKTMKRHYVNATATESVALEDDAEDVLAAALTAVNAKQYPGTDYTDT
jgi:hypothetical protein